MPPGPTSSFTPDRPAVVISRCRRRSRGRPAQTPPRRKRLPLESSGGFHLGSKPAITIDPQDRGPFRSPRSGICVWMVGSRRRRAVGKVGSRVSRQSTHDHPGAGPIRRRHGAPPDPGGERSRAGRRPVARGRVASMEQPQRSRGREPEAARRRPTGRRRARMASSVGGMALRTTGR
jgi:hypothetical protein